jgi:hypothetical protein
VFEISLVKKVLYELWMDEGSTRNGYGWIQLLTITKARERNLIIPRTFSLMRCFSGHGLPV